MNATSPARAGTLLAGVTVSVSGGDIRLPPTRSAGIVITPSRRGCSTTEYCVWIVVAPLTIETLRWLLRCDSSKSRCSGA